MAKSAHLFEIGNFYFSTVDGHFINLTMKSDNAFVSCIESFFFRQLVRASPFLRDLNDEHHH